MTFLVAYDGSPLAKSALLRASEFGGSTETAVRVITVLTRDGRLAHERSWLEPGEAFDRKTIEQRLTAEVHAHTPDADVGYTYVEKHAARGRITRAIRASAEEIDVDVLFVGSESAGRFVSALSSVGQGVAYGEYDLYVVRRPHPDLD